MGELRTVIARRMFSAPSPAGQAINEFRQPAPHCLFIGELQKLSREVRALTVSISEANDRCRGFDYCRIPITMLPSVDIFDLRAKVDRRRVVHMPTTC